MKNNSRIINMHESTFDINANNVTLIKNFITTQNIIIRQQNNNNI